MPGPCESEGPRPDDDRGWWQELVGRVLDEVGASVDRAAYFTDLWSEFAKPGVWKLFPETHSTLVTLGQRCRLGVISNFDSRLHAILVQLGITHFFEHVIVSSEVGADKPSARIFEEALDRFDITPDFALHVGDERQADWVGAAAAGLGVFRLERPSSGEVTSCPRKAADHHSIRAPTVESSFSRSTVSRRPANPPQQQNPMQRVVERPRVVAGDLNENTALAVLAAQICGRARRPRWLAKQRMRLGSPMAASRFRPRSRST